jgi:D-inositol-3-phosphate glycosyltransferase
VLLGAKKQNALIDYYNAASIVVMPSRYESFGMVAIEALACGTPVIAANVGGLSIIIEDGVNGYLFPMNDFQALAKKIILLLKNQALCQKFRDNARKSVVRFSWVTIANNLLASFHSIL